MLELLHTATLFLLAGVTAMWAAVVIVRQVNRRRAARRDRRLKAAASVLLMACEAEDVNRLAAGLVAADASLMFDIVSRLLSMLNQENRAFFESALLEIGFDQAIQESFSRGSRSARVRYCEMLAALNTPLSRKVLRHALNDQSHKVRLAAAIALAKLQPQQDVRQLLMLVGPESWRSTRLVLLLEELVPNNVGQICTIADDASMHNHVRIAARLALRRLWDAKVPSPIQLPEQIRTTLQNYEGTGASQDVWTAAATEASTRHLVADRTN